MISQKACITPFNVIFSYASKIFCDGRDTFVKLGVNDQIKVLVNMVSAFRTGRSSTCDFEKINGKKRSLEMRLNSNLSNAKGCKSIRIIDQSPAGMYEKASPNLLTL